QSFTLTVAADIPNRPPLFTSTPEVDINAGRTYFYQAAATDADSDELSYALASHPAGMTIDQESGSIVWIPRGSSSVDGVEWDPAKDYSDKVNPGGAWTYGWTSTLGSTLHVYPEKILGSGLHAWYDPAIVSSGAPSVAHNSSDQPIQ